MDLKKEILEYVDANSGYVTPKDIIDIFCAQQMGDPVDIVRHLASLEREEAIVSRRDENTGFMYLCTPGI